MKEYPHLRTSQVEIDLNWPTERLESTLAALRMCSDGKDFVMIVEGELSFRELQGPRADFNGQLNFNF